jgi:hypothetical protein
MIVSSFTIWHENFFCSELCCHYRLQLCHVCKTGIICDHLWENPAKVTRQNSDKKGKSKKNQCVFFVLFFFSKYAPLIHFIQYAAKGLKKLLIIMTLSVPMFVYSSFGTSLWVLQVTNP